MIILFYNFIKINNLNFKLNQLKEIKKSIRGKYNGMEKRN